MASKVRDEGLTAAFRRPNLVANVIDFAAVCAVSLDGKQIANKLVMQKGILLERELEFKTVLGFLVLSILVCVVTGLVVGLLSRRFDIAIGLGGGMFTITQIVEAALLWRMNR